MADENPYQSPKASTDQDPGREAAARKRGLRRGFFLGLLLWGCFLTAGLVEIGTGTGPYRGILLMMMFFFGGPAAALLQWAYLLPWALTRAEDQAAYRDGLVLGGVIFTGLGLLLPGLACLGMRMVR